MAIEWLAGNRLRGTTAERPSASLQSPSVGGWVEVGRTTLGSNSSSISVDSLADKRYYMILSDFQVQGTNNDHSWRFNNDSGSNYATRYNYNGGSDGTFTSQGQIVANGGTASRPNLNIVYVANKSNKEKLLMSHINQSNSSGAGDTMTRSENVGKWANTSNAINRIDAVTSNGGGYNSGSEVVVLGWDPSDSHTTNFWEELASVDWSSGKNISTGTFTPKKYLWVQAWMTKTGTTGGSVYLRAGNSTVDTGSNYAHRYNINGGSDGTQTSNSNGWFLDQGSSAGTDQWFLNAFFINNSGNEKLGIMHNTWVDDPTASYAPGRTEHVGKWANTSDQINIFDINGLTIDDFTGGQIKVWGAD